MIKDSLSGNLDATGISLLIALTKNMRFKMKMLFFILLALLFVPLIPTAEAATGSALKPEGTCSGTLADGTSVSLTYYSNFDGCKKTSKGAVAFHSGIEGLITGSRSFKSGKDYYNFPKNDLTFADSTGNTSGKLGYRDDQNVRHVVVLQCDVRDYEYADCN